MDFAKGVAIAGVVCAHHASGMKESPHAPSYMLVGKIIFSVVMPFFFMVSAAFFRSRLENAEFSAVEILGRITSSLLKPFYTLSALFFIMNLATPQSLGMPSALEMTRALIYMQSNGAIAPSGVLWFLFTLFTASFVTLLSIRILKVNPYVMLALASVLKVLAYRFNGIYYFGVDKLFANYVYYMIGYALSGYILSGALFRHGFSIVLYLGYWVAAFGYRLVLPFTQSLVYDIVTGYGVFISASGCFFLLDLAKRFTSRFPSSATSNALQYCGFHSILIYVFHTPVGLAIEQLFKWQGIAEATWTFAILVVTGIVIPLFIGMLLRRCLPVHKLLLGRNL